MSAVKRLTKRIRDGEWLSSGAFIRLDMAAAEVIAEAAEEEFAEGGCDNLSIILERSALRRDLYAERENADALRKELDYAVERLRKCIDCGLKLVDSRNAKVAEVESLRAKLTASNAGYCQKWHYANAISDDLARVRKQLADKIAECEYATEQLDRLRKLTALPADACAEDVADAIVRKVNSFQSSLTAISRCARQFADSEATAV